MPGSEGRPDGARDTARAQRVPVRVPLATVTATTSRCRTCCSDLYEPEECRKYLNAGICARLCSILFYKCSIPEGNRHYLEKRNAHRRAAKSGDGMANMTQFAHLEMEFRQGAMTLFFPTVAGTTGACLALTADWLREKKQGTNSIGAKLGRAFGSDERKFVPLSGARGGAQQLAALNGALDAQKTYEAATGSQQDRIKNLLTGKDLVVDVVLSEAAYDQIPVNIQGSYPVTLNVQATFVKATGIDWLKRGRGVCIGIGFGSSGHAVAAYRSHGGSLYFFDPNMGIYAVKDPSGFFDAWNQRCLNKGKSIDLNDRYRALIYV